MKTVVAVLRGGPTPFYDASLMSGGAVLAALNPEKYTARDVFVNRDGYWHQGGSAVTPERALRGTDVVFNCIHGHYGTDGWLHQLISKLGHKIVGSRPGPLAVAYNRERSKLQASYLGILIPAHQVLSRVQDLDTVTTHLFRSFPMPAVVKPVGGSAKGLMTIATDIFGLRTGIEAALALSPKILVEEYIGGSDASVGVVEGLRNNAYWAFTTGDLGPEQKRVLEELACRMHESLGLSHYSNSDFIVNSRGVYYVGTNALPELHKESRFVAGLESKNVPMEAFVEHVVALAQK